MQGNENKEIDKHRSKSKVIISVKNEGTLSNLFHEGEYDFGSIKNKITGQTHLRT